MESRADGPGKAASEVVLSLEDHERSTVDGVGLARLACRAWLLEMSRVVELCRRRGSLAISEQTGMVVPS